MQTWSLIKNGRCFRGVARTPREVSGGDPFRFGLHLDTLDDESVAFGPDDDLMGSFCHLVDFANAAMMTTSCLPGVFLLWRHVQTLSLFTLLDEADGLEKRNVNFAMAA